MYLIQLLLPLYDNQHQSFGQAAFDRVRNELTERFGGVTAFRRSPAEGTWKEDSEVISRDEIVTFEVMSDKLDYDWWDKYRSELEQRFRQDELIVRATQIIRL